MRSHRISGLRARAFDLGMKLLHDAGAQRSLSLVFPSLFLFRRETWMALQFSSSSLVPTLLQTSSKPPCVAEIQ